MCIGLLALSCEQAIPEGHSWMFFFYVVLMRLTMKRLNFDQCYRVKCSDFPGSLHLKLYLGVTQIPKTS